jgi:hypothetical protein
MTNPPPHGIAVGGGGNEAARLAKEILALCSRWRVNTLHDLPAEPFQEASQLQARIDQIRQQQRDVLAARGHRGLAKAHANAQVRFAARINAFRAAIAARGGLEAVNKLRLSNELGLSRSTVSKYVKLLRAEQEAGPPRCPACGQLIPPPEVLSVLADIARQETESTNHAAHRVADQGDQP